MFDKVPKKTILFNYRKKLSFYKYFLVIFFMFILIVNLIIYHNFFFIVEQGNDNMLPNINLEDLLLVRVVNIKSDTNVAELMEILPRGSIIALNSPQNKPNAWWVKLLDVPVYFFTFGWVKLNHHEVMIARLLGYPGEKIKIQNKVLYLDDRPYTPEWVIRYQDVEIFPANVFGRDNLVTRYIDNGKLFILNDNWDTANDSRQFGEVPLNEIVGKSIYIYHR